MSITKHKQDKARRRAQQKRKEIRMHKHSYRGKDVSTYSTVTEHPKPMSKEELLAQRVPIEEEDNGSN